MPIHIPRLPSRIRSVLVTVLAWVGLLSLLLVLEVLLHPSVKAPPAVPVACAVQTSPQPRTPEELYLDLLKKTLTRAQVASRYERHTFRPRSVITRLLWALPGPLLHSRGFELVRVQAADPNAYMDASDFNLSRLEDGETMAGLRQLDNVQFCVTDALRNKIPGDLIEAGAWRGGITILMRAVLKAYGDASRKVWVADSFEGLPDFDHSKNPGPWTQGMMAVSLEEARENFAKYGLLDDQVAFLKGFFNQTLNAAPITKLAVFRSDGDLYESTMDALNSLYPKLSVGGYAIFDDYNSPGCRKAIDEYRAAHGITEAMQPIDSLAVYWRREK